MYSETQEIVLSHPDSVLFCHCQFLCNRHW